jgi:hypothetical protein
MTQRTSKIKRVLAFQLFLVGAALWLSGSAHALDVTLAWEEVSGVDHYVVYWGPSSRNYTDESGAVWQNFYVLSEPALPHQRYYFAVRAFNSQGGSGFSDEICLLGSQDFEPPHEQYNRGWAVTTGYLKGFKILYHDSEPVAPTLGGSGQIPTANLNGLKPVGIPLDLEPSGRNFKTPITIFIPCPGYSEIEGFSVCLYEQGRGWVLAWDGSRGKIQEAAEGWLADEPIYHNYNPSVGVATVEVQLHHFSGVQVAAPEDARGVASTSSDSSTVAGTAGGGGGCFVSTIME